MLAFPHIDPVAIALARLRCTGTASCTWSASSAPGGSGSLRPVALRPRAGQAVEIGDVIF